MENKDTVGHTVTSLPAAVDAINKLGGRATYTLIIDGQEQRSKTGSSQEMFAWAGAKPLPDGWTMRIEPPREPGADMPGAS